jgi:hypothetical protein
MSSARAFKDLLRKAALASVAAGRPSVTSADVDGALERRQH